MPSIAPQVVIGTARKNPDDLRYLTELLEEGTIRPVIDRCIPLEQTAEGRRYVVAGHKDGNVVITIVGEAERANETGASPVEEHPEALPPGADR